MAEICMFMHMTFREKCYLIILKGSSSGSGTVSISKLEYRTGGNFWWHPEIFPAYSTKIYTCIWDVLVLRVCFTISLALV